MIKDIFLKLATRIIEEQEMIIGPIAWEEANKVQGLTVSKGKKEVKMDRNQKETIEKLIKQYSKLFGKASEEVCKDAVKDLIADLPVQEVPSILR